MGAAGDDRASGRPQSRANVEQTPSPVKPSPAARIGGGLAALCALLLSSAAGAQDLPPEADGAGEAPHAVYNGTVTEGWDTTVALLVDGPPPWVICSGTLIRPDVVLTAAHCVEDYVIDWVHFGSTPYEGGGINVEVTSQIAHPDYAEDWFDLGKNGDLSDLALLFLAEDGPVEPMREFTDEPERILGEPATLVGFGLNAVDAGAGSKREATISLNHVAGDMLVGGSGDGNACSGDSGGSTYVDLPWGIELVGATSFSYGGTCDGTNGVGAVMASEHLDWLNGLAGEPPDRPEGAAWDDSIGRSLSRDADEAGCAFGSRSQSTLALLPLLFGSRRRR